MGEAGNELLCGSGTRGSCTHTQVQSGDGMKAFGVLAFKCENETRWENRTRSDVAGTEKKKKNLSDVALKIRNHFKFFLSIKTRKKEMII